MKYLVKVLLVASTAMTMFVTAAFGATVVATPSQLPKGAYVNGGDGDQQFFQTLLITLNANGGTAWAAGDDIVILLPDDIRVADTDEVGDYDDEVSVSLTSAVALGLTVAAATAGSITLDLATGAAVAAGDIVLVIFPITTEESPASSTADYTIKWWDASAGPPAYADLEATNPTAEITFVDTLTLVDFADANWDAGLKQSSRRGDVYPDVGGVVVIALTDFVPEQTAGVVSALVNGGTDWDLMTLNATDDDFVHPWVNPVLLTGEVGYRLWASQTPALKRVFDGVGTIPIHVTDGFEVDGAVEGETFFDYQTAAVASNTLLDGKLLDEGYWFFYVTSSLSADWVLGSSDTVEIRHHPDFCCSDYTVGYMGDESGIDYTDNQVFDPTVTDNENAINLESGGVIGKDATTATPNMDSLRIYWTFEDVDDPAEVHVFVSTSTNLEESDIVFSGTAPDEQVDGLTGATKIHSDIRYEESGQNYVTWYIYTDASTYVTAGDYSVYIVTNDGKNQVLEKVTDYNVAGGPIDLTVTVQHFPWLDFHDVYGIPAAFNTADDEYYIVSWGETVDGDKDPDAEGTGTIDLYYINAAAPGLYVNVCVDIATSVTSTPVTYLQNNGTLITTITDDGDTQADNRYMWDVRGAGLTDAAVYHVYGVINHGADYLTVQLNADGDYDPLAVNDRAITITHGEYLRAATPFAGPPVELDQGDQFRLTWESFDLNGASDLVQAVAVQEGTSNPGTGTWTTWSGYLASNIIWLLPSAPTGALPGAGVGVTGATGSSVITVSDYILDAAGAGLPNGTIPEGNYEVYYFFSSDAAFDGEAAVKAPGMLYFSEQGTETYDIRLSPNKASMSPGDILTVDVYVTDDGDAPTMAIFFVEIPKASYFTIVDQDGDPDDGDIEPFDNLRGTTTTNTLAGDVLMNNLETTAGDVYRLGYLESNPANVANLSDDDIVSFQILMTEVIADPIEDLEITFSKVDPYITNLYELDGAPQTTSIPTVALKIRLGQPGSMAGVVDVEGRDDEGQTVSFFLSSSGGMTPITTQSFLDANNDADGSDGVQITLGGAGYYTLEGIPTGEYDVRLRLDRHLDVVEQNMRFASLDEIDFNFTGANKLKGGDAAGYTDAAGNDVPNNRVQDGDIDAISDAFGTSSGQENWNTWADIDESGEVDINDLFMASKNKDDDGDGIVYKALPGSNEDAMIWLALVDETAEGTTYAVRAENLGSLHAYSVEMFVSSDEWEIVGFEDGLGTISSASTAYRIDGSNALYGSAVLGYNPVAGRENMDLMYLTLRPEAGNPETPTVSEVTLIDANGDMHKALIGGFDAGIPEEFSLSQNYPNPFNPSTTINFALPEEGNVKLAVYNLLGQEIRTLVSSAMEPGTYKAIWNSRDDLGRRVTSGIYFYRLVVDNKVISTHKMVLLK